MMFPDTAFRPRPGRSPRPRFGRIVEAMRSGITAVALVLAGHASAQQQGDTLRLAFVVRTPSASAASRLATDPVANVSVARNDIALGVTNDSGYVLVANLPSGRNAITFRAPTYAPLTCRVSASAGRADTVDVSMMLERKVAVWTTPGCRKR